MGVKVVVIALIMLLVSAFFGAYVRVFYDQQAGCANFFTFVLFLAGIVMSFVETGWFGIVILLAYWFLFFIFGIFWNNRYLKHLKNGSDPHHGLPIDKRIK